MDIMYHLGKAHIMVDALSRKVVLSQVTTTPALQQEIQHKQIEIVIRLLTRLDIRITLLNEILASQATNEWCAQMIQRVTNRLQLDFKVLDEVLRFKDKVCILQDDELRTQILTEAYSALYTVYPKSVKIY